MQVIRVSTHRVQNGMDVDHDETVAIIRKWLVDTFRANPDDEIDIKFSGDVREGFDLSFRAVVTSEVAETSEPEEMKVSG